MLVTAAGAVSLVGTSGSLLGVMKDIDVPVDELLLRPGDALVF